MIWTTLFFIVSVHGVVILTESLNQSNVYCVKTKGGNCEASSYQCQECQTLMWFVVNHNIDSFGSNTKMYFLQGQHSLTSEAVGGLVMITNVTNFTMEGYGNVTLDYQGFSHLPTSRIMCNNFEGGFHFLNSVDLSINRISFENCGVNVTFMPDNFTVQAALSFRTCKNVIISEVLIDNSTGYGLQVDRVHGRFVIKKSSFNASKPSKYNNFGGNARFWYNGTTSTSGTSLLIEDSNFKYGCALSPGSSQSKTHMPNGGGLLLLIYSSSINIRINRINASQNFGHQGANVAFVITDFHENTSTISINDSFIGYGQALRGGGMMCYVRLHHSSNHQSCEMTRRLSYKNHTIVNVSHNIFHSNNANFTGGAVYIHQHEMSHIDCTLRKVSFTNCAFTNNTSLGRGAAVAIIKHRVHSISPHNSPQFSVIFQRCAFFDNKCMNVSKRTIIGSVVTLQAADSVTVQNSRFINNNGTAISLTSSSIIFNGNITFKGNTAAYGGAIKVCDSSIIYITPNTGVKFIENVAEFSGGAIYAEQRCVEVAPPCFYQPLVKNDSVTPAQLSNMMQMEFINNNATIAGKAIYGGSVDHCFTISQFAVNKSFFGDSLIFEAINNLSQQPGPSAVTSDPYGVCFCNSSTNKPLCSEDNHVTIMIFPGETFNISVSAVGQVLGMVPSLIKLQSKMESTATRVKFTPTRDRDQAELCQTIEIFVLTRLAHITLEAMVQRANPAVESSSFLKRDNPKINVVFKECPWIFSNELGSTACDCAPLLLRNGIKCDIKSRTFLRASRLSWIGCHQDNNTMNNSMDADLDYSSVVPCTQIVFSKQCLEEHCSNAIMNITASNMSAQCNEGREGTLCSVCKQGYSLSLGTSRCIKNEYCSALRLTVLLIVFIFAGVLLVIILTLLNLTVTEGTICGLLFYANIVHTNIKFFFPGDSGISNANLLRIFIAWLNLDFGFEVCFYTGMNAYHEVWLEFVFLFYLLLLGVLIIITSRRYVTMTRLVGRNVVNVLSTVIVLSYSKLIRTSIGALYHTRLEFSDNPKGLLIWRNMGNLDFFKGKHIPLVILAILMCIISFLYTLSLLFIQCLQRRSNWCILRWVNKLRTFFDSNTGPCRDSYRFWPGFLLFTRYAMFFVSSIENNSKHRLNIVLAVSVVAFILACVSPRGVYKKRSLNVLEFSFLLNLGLLSGLVVNFYNVPSYIFTYCSVGISVATFVCILVFHSYKRISETRRWKRIVKKIREKHQRQQPCTNLEISGQEGCHHCKQLDNVTAEQGNGETECNILHHQAMPPVVRFDRLREPLLVED